ncbi:MAG: type II toxin-antitoxin system VapC family toxin [Deltaproteobacteria bacterium]|nr:MAG: type II toxin-antitoxin system VapC family toxin [Deltaproteobacteria bacterium]
MSWPPGNAPGRRAAAARHARVPVVAVFLSAASVWEITTKARLGKLPRALAVAADVPAAMASQGFAPLSITAAHAQRAGSLPGSHRDPFDRMLVAQADLEGLPIVSMDAVFD